MSIYTQISKKIRGKKFICPKCKYAKTMTIDHIIPESLLWRLGVDNKESDNMKENYQLMCKGCNLLKGGKIDWENKKSKEILLRIINNK